MHHYTYQKSHQRPTSGRSLPDPWVLLVGALAMLLFALPALVLGLVGVEFTYERRWFLPLWLGLAALGLALTILLALHSLEQEITRQIQVLVSTITTHQMQVAGWDLARLWEVTWPIWLRTLPLAPVVAVARTLALRRTGIGTDALQQQEHQRQHAVAQAQRRATRWLRRLDRVPAACHDQMVIGVPIDDEMNA